MTIKLVAFDLDDTLAPSKSALPAPMAEALADLLEHVPVCIISGGQLSQFENQVLAHLPARANLANLHLMPTCGTRYLRHHSDTVWGEVYAHDLPERVRLDAINILEEEGRRLGLWEDETWGRIIEDRGSQITYSALGQDAPLESKKAWDPTGEKRSLLREAVEARLPELEVRSGGSTSIDITRKGIDKAFGLERLVQFVPVDFGDILFIGDRLDPDGHDFPVDDRCRRHW
jgi:HAD superfamily hydrolase (TIGR01484 family)